MAKKASTSAGYRLHKASGQAIVKIQGRVYYLGKYGSPGSKEKYHRLVAESIVCKNFGVEKTSISVAEAVIKYLEHAKEYYANGNEYKQNIYASRPLIDLYPSLRLAKFGISELELVRNWWIERLLSEPRQQNGRTGGQDG